MKVGHWAMVAIAVVLGIGWVLICSMVLMGCATKEASQERCPAPYPCNHPHKRITFRTECRDCDTCLIELQEVVHDQRVR